MLTQRWRPVLYCTAALIVIWGLAMLGYGFAKASKMTAEKLKAYIESVDLNKLSAAERAKAIKELADRLNALSIEERRKARADRAAWAWFSAMTEQEKSSFIDLTMPTGFKQMLTAFEQLPDDKRRRAIDDALRRLKDTQTRLQTGTGLGRKTQELPEPVLSEDLQKQIRTIGLKAFYTQSSAQTKAELAPVLEELQRVMESGRPFRHR